MPTAVPPGIMWLMAVPTPPFPEQPPRPHARVWLRRALIAIGALTLFVGSAVGVGALWAFTILPRSLPSVTALETLQPVQGSRIYDDNDEPMTELHVERRIFVPLAQIPPALRDAIIATEDRRSYSHWAVDPIGIARAVVQNYRRGHTATRARPAATGGARGAERGGGDADSADGPGPPRARAAPDHRPMPPRLRPADARGEVRRRPRLQGRSEHLHDPEPLDAAR